MDIIWKGNSNTNSSSRQEHVPFVIVNHISTGSLSSMDYWFTDPNNRVSSAHFGVGRDGSVHQYVAIERMAWANGLTAADIRQAPAPVVRAEGINPNLYTVSIEHEGKDGELTEDQFQASVKLHRYIRNSIREKWGKTFPLDAYHVIGHHQINPVTKPNCPGPRFPWDRLYAALAEPERGDEDMEQLMKRIEELEARNTELTKRIARLEGLLKMEKIPAWAQASVKKAVDKGLVKEPEGSSLDFYRFLAILDRKGLLD